MPTVPFTGPGQGPRLLPQGQQDVRATPAMFGGLQAEAMGHVANQMARARQGAARPKSVSVDMPCPVRAASPCGPVRGQAAGAEGKLAEARPGGSCHPLRLRSAT